MSKFLNFEPSVDYDTLLKQSKSMHMMLETVAKERGYWRDKAKLADDSYIQSLLDEIESERDMNDKLTRELMKYE